MPAQWIALLGARDQPTDAVEEYCLYLSKALESKQISLEVARLRWPEIGWRHSLRELRSRLKTGNVQWVLIQYTALSWSRRGFPPRVLRAIKLVKSCDCRCAIVFHDMQAYPGTRFIDKVRRTIQQHTMRWALELADRTIFTVPPEKIAWVFPGAERIEVIPVGANLPFPEKAWSQKSSDVERKPTVAIYSFTDGPERAVELDVIANALRHARGGLSSLTAELLGRHSEASGRTLREKLADTDIEINVHGVRPPEDVVRILGSGDVLLFVRNEISGRRGSAIAGIACGLPVIAREGTETAAPITDAGVVLLPANATSEFGPALLRVLTDRAYRDSLAERSRLAQKRYFSWSVIAEQYAHALRADRNRR
jgi:glycosyltransferase involved in cell wall biosynthesis